MFRHLRVIYRILRQPGNDVAYFGTPERVEVGRARDVSDNQKAFSQNLAAHGGQAILVQPHQRRNQ